VPPSGGSWPGRPLARGSAWLHPGGAWRAARDSGDKRGRGHHHRYCYRVNEAGAGRDVIQGLVNGESEGEGKMPRQSSGGGCSTDLAQRVVTAVSSRLDCAR
jgi:hypothetical protein